MTQTAARKDEQGALISEGCIQPDATYVTFSKQMTLLRMETDPLLIGEETATRRARDMWDDTLILLVIT